MNVKQRFRFKKNDIIKDADATQKPLSSSSKSADKLQVIELSERIGGLQNVFYANGKYKLLIILQGTDTAGKDGAVKDVFGRVDPLGVRCVPFKAPTEDERAHDFLWRIHKQVPASRELVIFNRSHYEDVLVPLVQDLIDQKECKHRYAQIRDFEQMLAENGTLIIKFFLHISKDEQKSRLEDRLADPDKHWKFNPDDLAQRKLWDDYQSAYQKALSETDADHAPWYVIPANSKTHRNLAIASIVVATLEELKLSYPPANPDFKNLKVE